MPPLLSPKTADYVAALIREGDNFDYWRWLKEVQEKERRARQALTEHASGELARAELNDQGNSPERRHVKPISPPVPINRISPIFLAIRRSQHKSKDKTPKARLRRRLEKICEAWNDFQSSRARDAVYGYLAHVFAIVEHYKARQKTRKLLRHAFKFADLPFDKNADPFAAIIR